MLFTRSYDFFAKHFPQDLLSLCINTSIEYVIWDGIWKGFGLLDGIWDIGRDMGYWADYRAGFCTKYGTGYVI